MSNKLKIHPFCILILSALLLYNSINCQELNHRFEHSFNQPLIIVDGRIPFWEIGGSTVLYETHVELTPPEKSKAGWISNTWPMRGNDWEVNFQFTATSNRYGADGIAFWYTKDPQKGGDAMGGADYWTGLGIFFDTHDNDHDSNNPSIYGIWNDGTKQYQHRLDGGKHVFGRCDKVMFRNSKVPVDVKISYINEQLELMYRISGEWISCFSSYLQIPSGYYFGLSAATGKYFDRHMIHSFNVKSNSQNYEDELFKNEVNEDKDIRNSNRKTHSFNYENQDLSSNNADQLLKGLNAKLNSQDGTPQEFVERIHTSLDKLMESSENFNDFLIKKLDSLKPKPNKIPIQSFNQAMKLVGTDILAPLRKYKPLNNLNLDATKEKITSTAIRSLLEDASNQILTSNNFLQSRIRKYFREGSAFDYWIILLIVQILIILFLYIRVRRRIKKYDF